MTPEMKKILCVGGLFGLLYGALAMQSTLNSPVLDKFKNENVPEISDHILQNDVDIKAIRALSNSRVNRIACVETTKYKNDTKPVLKCAIADSFTNLPIMMVDSKDNSQVRFNDNNIKTYTEIEKSPELSIHFKTSYFNDDVTVVSVLNKNIYKSHQLDIKRINNQIDDVLLSVALNMHVNVWK